MVSETLVRGPAEGLAGLLNAEVPGESLPLMWHWVYLLERPAAGALGADGHPVAGIPAPPGPGMRRMFAGGQVTAYGPLYLGREATRRSEVVGRREKQGRSGPLTFVTVRHTIEQDGRTAVVDRQDIVYLPERSGSPAPSRRPAGAPEGEPADGVYQPGPPSTRTLFQFSALTYNAHRIHYDRDYAREVEGHPDLVVHGPLQALYLAEAARRWCRSAGRPVPVSCRYRLLAPLFLGDPLWLALSESGAEVHVEVRTGERVTATADLSPEPDPDRVRGGFAGGLS
jgi:3-methylfumaryl-CoA hydratase